MQQSPAELASSVMELDSELSDLARSMETIIRVKQPFEEFCPSEVLNADQALTILCTYYILLFQVHTPITYPWFGNSPKLKGSADMRELVESSTQKVLDASRAALMTTAHIRISADTSIQ